MTHCYLLESSEVAGQMGQQAVIVTDRVVPVSCYYYCDHFRQICPLLLQGKVRIPTG